MTLNTTSKIVSKYETSTPARSRAVNCVLVDHLRAKGWSVQAAAAYLGVSRQRLYAVFADSDRIRLWECAIAGMPLCTPAIEKSLKKHRNQNAVATQAPPSVLYPFAVGDVVVCDKYAGIADEGDEGTISAIRGAASAPEMLVQMPGGEDWFALHLFNDYFLTTGR